LRCASDRRYQALIVAYHIGREDKWKGRVDHKSKKTTTEDRDLQGEFLRPPIEAKKSRWGLRGKTVWDWMQLLIVPIVLLAISVAFTLLQDARLQQIEDQRAKRERGIEDQRAQASALQSYIDQMSRLLTEENLSESPEDEVRRVARAHTLTVLGIVEGERKFDVVQFLAENELIQGDDPIVNLRTADLKGAQYEGATDEVAAGERVGQALNEVNLSGTQLDNANLQSIQLHNARMNEALTYNASLEGAKLQRVSFMNALIVDTDLTGANLNGAEFDGAVLENTDLSGASLVGADISAYLAGTCFIHADLRDADLEAASQFTNDQLQQAFGNQKTKLPENLRRPDAWSQPIEQQWKDKGYVPNIIPLGTNPCVS
jgi:uncharacterized protein YjbI with pentapeptide repeats